MTSATYNSSYFAKRDMKNTDVLAFRSIAQSQRLTGLSVLDLGCGAGRSTRFIRDLDNAVVGVDRRSDMIEQAKRRDADGAYLLVSDPPRLPFADTSFDAVFASWVLMEESSGDRIIELLRECRRVVGRGGTGVFVTNTKAFYRGDWHSCHVNFEVNHGKLRSGQPVKACLLPEGVEVNDYFWSDEDYRAFFDAAGFRVVERDLPLGTDDDGLPWKDEKHTAPYSVYYLDTHVDA